MQSERMNVYDFGRALLETQDLDPVYVMLHRAAHDQRFGEAQLKRWLLGYWMFYHAGVASFLSEDNRPEVFFERCREADRQHYPRGSERRHFRGHTCAGAFQYLEQRYKSPEEAVTSLYKFDGRAGQNLTLPFGVVFKRVKEWYGFGSWIAFKVADMLERVMGIPISFDDAVLNIYEEPAKAAGLMGMDLRGAVLHLTEHFSTHLAPPLHDRPVGVQEVETIMCKWKSHLNGHYAVGKDSKEIAEGLRHFQHVPTAAMLEEYVPGWIPS